MPAGPSKVPLTSGFLQLEDSAIATYYGHLAVPMAPSLRTWCCSPLGLGRPGLFAYSAPMWIVARLSRCK